ncbi:mucin-1-like, partial [Frankliniella occidentalis]|uniref:Mucin-1-like n=1 Tax=Frankliniella occidentalis TaxID=133901 RepID=A0A9C6XVG7_FRAOC
MSVGEPIRLSEDDEDDEVSRMSEDSEDDQRTISAHQLSGGERSRLTEDSEDDERIISTKASAGELSGLSEDDSVCERPEQHVSLREAAALALLARRAGGAAIKAPSASKTPSSRGGSTPRLRAAAAAASDSDSDETLRQREEARCRRRERELSRQSSKRSLVATPPAKRKGARASTHETAAMNRTISSPRHVMDVPPAPVAASTSDSGVEGDRHAVRRSKSVEAVPVVSASGPQCSQPPPPPPRAYDQTTDDEVPPARRTFISPPPRHRAPSTTTETSTKTSSSTHPTSEPPSSITTSVSTLTHPLSEAASSEQEQEHGESSSALLQAQPKPRVPRMSISDIRVLCGAGHHPIQQPTHRPAQGPAQGPAHGPAHGPAQGPAEGPASVVHQAPAHTAPTRHSVSRVALGPQQGRRRPGDRSTPSEERVVATGQERRGSRKRSTPSEERVVATGKERRGSRKRSTPSEERVVATGKERRGSGKRSTPSEERVVATGQERRGSGKRSTPSTGERSTTTRRKTSVSLERIRTHTVDEQDSDSYSDSDLEGLDLDRAPSSVSAVSVASSRQSIGVDVVLGTRAFRRPQLPPSRTNDAPDKENIYPPVKAKRKHGPGDGDL